MTGDVKLLISIDDASDQIKKYFFLNYLLACRHLCGCQCIRGGIKNEMNRALEHSSIEEQLFFFFLFFLFFFFLSENTPRVKQVKSQYDIFLRSRISLIRPFICVFRSTNHEWKLSCITINYAMTLALLLDPSQCL